MTISAHSLCWLLICSNQIREVPLYLSSTPNQRPTTDSYLIIILIMERNQLVWSKTLHRFTFDPQPVQPLLYLPLFICVKFLLCLHLRSKTCLVHIWLWILHLKIHPNAWQNIFVLIILYYFNSTTIVWLSLSKPFILFKVYMFLLTYLLLHWRYVRWQTRIEKT